MLQKFPAPAFSATARLDCTSLSLADETGLLIFGLDYSYIGVRKTKEGYTVVQAICGKADKGTAEGIVASAHVESPEIYLRVEVKQENEVEIIPKVICSFSYSGDGKSFHSLGKTFRAREGVWVGAKVGLFSLAPSDAASLGHADVDWFRIESLKQ
jgi:beta-xylosidase